MKREQLYKMDAQSVRRDSKAYSAFKKFIYQDADEVFLNGKVPDNCFGCSFNSNFNKWKKAMSKGKKVLDKPAVDDLVYELKNKKSRVFFGGKVLRDGSAGSDWNAWINHNPKKKKERSAIFEKVPAKVASKAKTKEVDQTKE